MFTGIVEEVGEITAIERLTDSARLTVRGPLVTSDAAPGDSIAVNGVCLTVVGEPEDGGFLADVMDESLQRSALGDLQTGAPVNLERAAAVGGRLGGHIVQGHVDGVGTVAARTPGENWEVVRIDLPRELGRYVVEKGSITVDGVSLTVSACAAPEDGAQWLEVSLIPTTLAETILGRIAVGTRVNLEVDVLAKYVERLVRSAP